MSDAFADLEALMSKAQDMDRLAKGLDEQLTAASRSLGGGAEPLEPEEATFVRSLLGQLGLSMKNTNDERRYVEQLAVELVGVLEGSSEKELRGEGEEQKTEIMRKRGIVGLDEVWGGWNRAKGVGSCSLVLPLRGRLYELEIMAFRIYMYTIMSSSVGDGTGLRLRRAVEHHSELAQEGRCPNDSDDEILDYE